MGAAMQSQITSLTIVYPIVYWIADQRKHQSSASLAFVRGIHRRTAENVSISWRHHTEIHPNKFSWDLIFADTKHNTHPMIRVVLEMGTQLYIRGAAEWSSSIQYCGNNQFNLLEDLSNFIVTNPDSHLLGLCTTYHCLPVNCCIITLTEPPISELPPPHHRWGLLKVNNTSVTCQI